MTGKALVPRRASTRLVPRRTRITTKPGADLHHLYEPARSAWLRLLTPPAPHTYLADSEQCLISTRHHWIAPLRKMLRMGMKMGLAGALLFALSVLAPGILLLQVILFLAALGHTIWLGYVILRWRTDHVLVTDARIIRVTGIVTLTADAVNLAQITDATLNQSIPGRILGYGSIRIESAGQAQAIETLNYVPAPGEVYRALLRSEPLTRR